MLGIFFFQSTAKFHYPELCLVLGFNEVWKWQSKTVFLLWLIKDRKWSMTFSHGLAGLRASVKTHHKFTWKAGGSFLELHLKYSFVPALWAQAVFFRFHWKAFLSRCPLEGFEGIKIILESITWTKQFSEQHHFLHKSGLQARNRYFGQQSKFKERFIHCKRRCRCF